MLVMQNVPNYTPQNPQQFSFVQRQDLYEGDVGVSGGIPHTSMYQLDGTSDRPYEEVGYFVFCFYLIRLG